MNIRLRTIVWLTIGAAAGGRVAVASGDEAMARLADRIRQIRQVEMRSVSDTESVSTRENDQTEEQKSNSVAADSPAPTEVSKEPRPLSVFEVAARPLTRSGKFPASTVLQDSRKRAASAEASGERMLAAVSTLEKKPEDEPSVATEHAGGHRKEANVGRVPLPTVSVVPVLPSAPARPIAMPPTETKSPRDAGFSRVVSTFPDRRRAESTVLPVRSLTTSKSASGQRTAVPIDRAIAGVEFETVRIDRVGRIVRFQFPHEVSSVDVRDGTVCRVWKSAQREVTVVGVGPGETRFDVCLKHMGGRDERRFRVVVSADSPQLEAEQDRIRDVVRAAFPAAGIAIYSDRGRFVVEGVVPSEEEAVAVLSFVRGFCLQPVVDRIEVEKKQD